jgi:hypothetical protein
MRCEVRRDRFISICLPKEKAGTGESRRKGEAFGKKIWPGSIDRDGGWVIVALIGFTSFERAASMSGLMDLHSAGGHRSS